MSADPLPLGDEPIPRPTLLPGVRVTRRADQHLQVGLDEGLAVAFADTREARAALDAVVHGEPVPSGPVADRVYRRLRAEGLLVDARTLQAALTDADVADPQATAAVFTHADTAAPRLLAQRRSAIVGVGGPPRCTRTVIDTLALAGIDAVPLAALDAGRAAPTAALLVGCPEFDRDEVDGWTRRGVPHLLVQAVEGRWWVGPFVVPGENACLRCVDAHRRDREPGRGLVVEQYAGAPGAPAGGPADVPEPIDPAMAAVAMGWAARDLMSVVDGERPSTWSAAVRIGPAMWLEWHRWPRHPECGCGWDRLFG